jgi:hypothetical protein
MVIFIRHLHDHSASIGSAEPRAVSPRLLQPIAALNEFHQSFHEARRRSAVDDIVVEGDR